MFEKFMNKTKNAVVKFYSDESELGFLKCKVSKSLSEKLRGLMCVDFLPKGEGMLFPFSFPWIRFFYMKKVRIPLDIIFVDRNKKIINIYEAPVESGLFLKNYVSKGFCKYVVETNLGFCKKNNITRGCIIKIVRQ